MKGRLFVRFLVSSHSHVRKKKHVIQECHGAPVRGRGTFATAVGHTRPGTWYIYPRIFPGPGNGGFKKSRNVPIPPKNGGHHNKWFLPDCLIAWKFPEANLRIGKRHWHPMNPIFWPKRWVSRTPVHQAASFLVAGGSWFFGSRFFGRMAGSFKIQKLGI